MTLANFIVVTRPGFEVSAADPGGSAARIVDVRGLTSVEVSPLVKPGEQRIFVTDVVMRDVSASEVRRAAQHNHGAGLETLVPPEVAEYIRKYRLYRNPNEA
jgi:nicotinic acid mononucleotide adenylyltransferase